MHEKNCYTLYQKILIYQLKKLLLTTLPLNIKYRILKRYILFLLRTLLRRFL